MNGILNTITSIRERITETLEEAVRNVKTKPKSTSGMENMEGLVCRPAVEVKDRRNRRGIVKVKDFT